MIERAYREARSVNAHATDDAALCERLGLPVRVVRWQRARVQDHRRTPTSRGPTRCRSHDQRRTAVPFWSPAEIEASDPRHASRISRRAACSPTRPKRCTASAARSMNPSVERLVALKQREPGKPFLILVASQRDGRAPRISSWPATPRSSLPASGPARSRSCSPAANGACPRACAAPRAASPCAGRRIPASRGCSWRYGEPITSTSANRPGSPPAMSAGEVCDRGPPR